MQAFFILSPGRGKSASTHFDRHGSTAISFDMITGPESYPESEHESLPRFAVSFGAVLMDEYDQQERDFVR